MLMHTACSLAWVQKTRWDMTHLPMFCRVQRFSVLGMTRAALADDVHFLHSVMVPL